MTIQAVYLVGSREDWEKKLVDPSLSLAVVGHEAIQVQLGYLYERGFEWAATIAKKNLYDIRGF